LFFFWGGGGGGGASSTPSNSRVRFFFSTVAMKGGVFVAQAARKWYRCQSMLPV
jgi:hypothetical protein